MEDNVLLSQRAYFIASAVNSGVTPWRCIKKAYKRQILSAAKQGRYGCVITPYYTLNDPPTRNERIEEAEEETLIQWLESQGFNVFLCMPTSAYPCPTWSVTWE